MADQNVEVLRAVVTKADAHDKAVADVTAVRKELVTAKTEIARLTKLLNSTTAPVPTTPPVTVPPVTTTPATGSLVLKGNKIFRPNGSQFIARGPELTCADFPAGLDHVKAIGDTGANAMRMLLTLDRQSNMNPDKYNQMLTLARTYGITVFTSFYVWDKPNKYVIADALGGKEFYSLGGGLGGGSEETPANCYLEVWSRTWAKQLMEEHRDHVIIDAAQEYKAPDLGDVKNQEAWAISGEKAVKFFRAQGYTQPLVIMSAAQGRDLAAIIKHGDRIRKADTVLVDGNPQTMFGWQAYWNTSDNPTWYPSWQGELLTGKKVSVSAVEAMAQYVAKAPYPIQMGFDNNEADMHRGWKEAMDTAARLGLNWLWWAWDRHTNSVEANVDGAAAKAYVLNSPAGFKGSSKN